VTNSVVPAPSSLEYFKQEVESACERQHVHAQPLTTYYVVSLLNDFTHLPGTPAGEALASNEALGVAFVRALQRGGSEKRRALRQVGDLSLFISGFFSDSLRGSLVDVDYYMSLGGFAYGSLGTSGDVLSPVFGELSEKFGRFVDVLCEVSERGSLTKGGDVLRLYEKWVRTGSRYDGQRLVQHGIVPNRSASKRIQ
jgi:hypothetical protein